MAIEKLAFFCGSQTGSDTAYANEAKELAALIAAHKMEMVYGGGRKGLMGIVADAVMAGGGIVRGVIPKLLVNKEHQHEGISELLVVEDMHLRKRKMYELCDAVVILPGGFGTLDELFEVLTWNQLSLHDKKVFILNTKSFYDHLLQHLQIVEKQGFLWQPLHQSIIVLQQPSDIVLYLNED